MRVYSSILKGLIKENSEKHSGHARGRLVRQNEWLTVKFSFLGQNTNSISKVIGISCILQVAEIL